MPDFLVMVIQFIINNSSILKKEKKCMSKEKNSLKKIN